MPRKIIYLINPIAGTRKKSKLTALIAKRTGARGIDFEILSTSATGDYHFLINIIKEEKVSDVVICGGDGTINRIVNALQRTPVRIGIVPMGSGNGLALTAKIPRRIEKALDIIFSGKTSLVDAFFINDQFSCMLCGIGFDAGVAHAFAKQKKRGLQTYVRVALINFFRTSAFAFRIQSEQDVLQTDAFFISVANSNQFGNHFTIAPRASLQDGLLDIVIVKKMSKLMLPFYVLGQMAGWNRLQDSLIQHREKNIVYFQTDSLVIRNDAFAPLHIDGDPAETSQEFRIRVIKQCYQLLTP